MYVNLGQYNITICGTSQMVKCQEQKSKWKNANLNLLAEPRYRVDLDNVGRIFILQIYCWFDVFGSMI